MSGNRTVGARPCGRPFNKRGMKGGEWHSPDITEEGRGFHRGMIIFRNRNSVREQNYWDAPFVDARAR